MAGSENMSCVKKNRSDEGVAHFSYHWRVSSLSKKVSCLVKIYSWCIIYCIIYPLLAVSIFPDSFSEAARKRVTFGTASIQHLNASGSITPTAPPSPLITELFCSWAWPIGMAENIFLWINAQQSSLCETLMTSGWSFSSDISTIQSVNQGV